MPVKRVNPPSYGLGQQPGKQGKQGEPVVKIVWKGKRISKLVFPSGKTIEFVVA